MAPPWVMFDSVASSDGECGKGAEPDIAGIGVVISFILASIMTTVASILAMILDQMHDDKGRFALQAPIKYIRERFFDTEWKKEYAWRPFLDPLIISFGDQQLVTGYAVLLSAWIKVAQNSFEVYGAHFSLVLYICALSSSSLLAALITLRKYFNKYKLIAKVRLTLVVIYAVFLLCSMIAAISMPVTSPTNGHGVIERRHQSQRLAFIAPMLFILAGFSTTLVCIFYKPQRKTLVLRSVSSSGQSTSRIIKRFTDPKAHETVIVPSNLGLRIFYYLFLHPLIAFAVQILFAMLSVTLVLSQKFSRPDDPEIWCGLQGPDEDAWEFGQTLSLVMLLLPALSACQTYLEGRQDIQHGEPAHRRSGLDL